MTAFVKYDIQRSTYVQTPYTDSSPGLRAVFVVQSVQDIPDKGIFVFKQVQNGAGGDAIFSHIASIVDMADMPFGTPDVADVWFRTDTLDLVVHTEEQLDELITLLDGDIAVLNTGADNTNDLSNPESVTIPSLQTSVTPGGSTIGNGSPTLSIVFPVPLSVPPTGRVLVAVTPSILFKVTSVSVNGFDIVSSVNIETTHSVRWQVVSA